MTKNSSWDAVREKLEDVYSPQQAGGLVDDIRALGAGLDAGAGKAAETGFERLGPRDLALIAYADSIVGADRSPLATLHDFIVRYGLDEVFPNLHILPFYPWDTDRGFSVKDYYRVNPDYGEWSDCHALAARVRLMFDFVANHASIDNPLVQGALLAEHLDERDPEYAAAAAFRDYVIVYREDQRPGDEQLKSLARPRAFPVLTRYRVVTRADGTHAAVLGAPRPGEAVRGSGYVWTTFSRAPRADGTEDTRQVDLNFRNPAVFLETIRILLFYLQNRAELIRLDAIGYLWKRLGCSSLHEPECHRLIEVVNDVLKLLAPQVITIAEVNEPQEKAFLYLGTEEHPEADMAYQFSHFSMAIHAVLTGRARYYRDWLRSIGRFDGRQFTTVLGSHDGLAMKQARELLPEAEFETLCRILVEEHGGLSNMAVLPGGRKVVYEVCATPWDLINDPNREEDFELQLARFLAVAALGLCVPGIPAIYFQGLVGARNYRPAAGLDENRTVNREVFRAEQLYPLLDREDSREARVLRALTTLCRHRQGQPAFDPHTGFAVIDNASDACVSVRLEARAPGDHLLSLVNVGASPCRPEVPLDGGYVDVLSGMAAPEVLAPYQVCWLRRAAA